MARAREAAVSVTDCSSAVAISAQFRTVPLQFHTQAELTKGEGHGGLFSDDGIVPGAASDFWKVSERRETGGLLQYTYTIRSVE